MDYLYHEYEDDLNGLICQINGTSLGSLYSFLGPDHQLPMIISFKEILLSCRDKRFLIVGDYDCDGICATTIIRLLLKELGIQSNHYIPSRSKEGYGLNMKIVETALEHGFSAILCVDNGIVCNEEISQARNRGLSVFVIDHHEYGELPEADAILHPDLFPSEYGDMCAGGLCALLAGSFFEDEYIEVLGGLATLADMVKVLGYNRYLLKKMLSILKTRDIKPVRMLLGKSSIDYESLSFNVIPKINAVSRFDEYMNVNHVVYYLLGERNSEDYYFNIERINSYRKKWGNAMYDKARQMIDPDDELILLHSSEFKEGLCGIVANRLMHETDKPVIVLAEKEGELTGSGRSMTSFDIYAYLSGCKEIFSSFGGHSQAVGIRLDSSELERLTGYIKSNRVVPEKELRDVVVISENDIGMPLYEKLDALKPFGPGFREPLFCLKDPAITRRFVFSGRFCKYMVGRDLEAVDFHSPKVREDIRELIFSLRLNSYRNGSLSLIIEDLL